MSWEKIIPKEELNPEKYYFLGNRLGSETGMHYYSRLRSNKLTWSVKPGLACQFRGDEHLVKHLTEHPDWLAIDVPDDWETRWRRVGQRKRRK